MPEHHGFHPLPPFLANQMPPLTSRHLQTVVLALLRGTFSILHHLIGHLMNRRFLNKATIPNYVNLLQVFA
jgi:hypothetical protein